MSKPVAVLISDIHFTPATLELASAALLKAQYKARTLNLPLVIAGDTMDTKAILRAECVNKFIRMMSVIDAPRTYLMIGNHDLCNEKGDDHALQFAHGFCEVVSHPVRVQLGPLEVMLIPYQSDLEKLKSLLSDEEIPRTLIMHQGVQSAFMGHYTQDKTSLPKEAFANFQVISGHYHRAQSILCGSPTRSSYIGMFSYIGNPYTQNFGEANDPEKGFQLLHDDGSLEFVPTNLRKHLIVECSIDEDGYQIPYMGYKAGDIVWVKLSGPKSMLDTVDKEVLGKAMFKHSNYKLDLIPTDNAPVLEEIAKDLEPQALFDTVIDNTQESHEIKTYMKNLWREVTS